MIKAILFDMDGVLIDAKEWHYEALNKSLSLFGMEISRYDHLVTFDGLPTKRKLEMLTLERGFPKSLHPLVNDLKQEYTFEIIYSKCRPIFHHQYALAKLQQEGYKMACCSNSIRKTIEMMMQKAQLTSYLDFFLSNQDVQNAKPHPDIYLKAMEKLSLKPSEVLIVEDNEHGIKAAKASGGHLLKVETVYDVTYQAIKKRIKEIESEK
jgi:beta-phosphoglucomutase